MLESHSPFCTVWYFFAWQITPRLRTAAGDLLASILKGSEGDLVSETKCEFMITLPLLRLSAIVRPNNPSFVGLLRDF